MKSQRDSTRQLSAVVGRTKVNSKLCSNWMNKQNILTLYSYIGLRTNCTVFVLHHSKSKPFRACPDSCPPCFCIMCSNRQQLFKQLCVSVAEVIRSKVHIRDKDKIRDTYKGTLSEASVLKGLPPDILSSLPVKICHPSPALCVPTCQKFTWCLPHSLLAFRSIQAEPF